MTTEESLFNQAVASVAHYNRVIKEAQDQDPHWDKNFPEN